MTNLTRPIPGDPLALSNGKSSTQIIDEIEDVTEASEAALTARTSSTIVTTDQYSDIATAVMNDAEATTGWHSVTPVIVGVGNMTAGSNALVSTSGDAFTSDSVGRTMRVNGAGTAGAQLVTTVATFTDATHVTLAAAAVTSVTGTGWDQDTVGAFTSTTHSQGSFSVQANLKAPSNNLTPALYVNLTEAGFASGFTVAGGQNIYVDVLLESTGGGETTVAAFNQFSVVIASAVDLGGTTVVKGWPTTITSTMVTNTWYTVIVPVGSLTNIRSIGLKKTGTGGSGSSRAKWHLDNIRRAAISPIDQAYGSASSVAVVVPPSYPSTVFQQPILPSSLKALVDFRPGRAVISGLGGVKNIREWQLDETGVTEVGPDFQLALDSLSPGDTLVCPPKAIFRVDHGIQFNVPNVTFDAQGAAFIQGDPTPLFDGVNKVGISNDMTDYRVQIPADGVTLRRMRVFTSTITPQLGSAFTGAGGAAVSGTTMLLDAQNESASFSNVPCRDPLGRIRQDLVLSDTTHVAGDCVVTVTDDDGVVLTTQTIGPLTSTPTVYTIYATLRNVFAATTLKVTKATATANTITLTQMRTFSNAYTSWLNPLPEFAHAFMVTGDNCTIEDCTAECPQGDGINVANGLPSTGVQNLTVRRFFLRGCGRQGIAPCGGRNHRFEDCFFLYCGRHGVDFEPEFPTTTAVDTVFVKDMVIWKSNVVPPFQTGIPANAAPRIRNITVHGLRTYVQGGGIGGSFMDSRFSHLELRIVPGGNNADSTMLGRNIIWDDVRIDGAIQVGITGTTTGLDENLVSYTLGGLTLKNVLFQTRVSGEPYVDVQQGVAHLEDLRIADSVTLDTTAAVGSIKILPDTTFHNIDLTPHRALLPNSYPGQAIGTPWFPGGLDMKRLPVSGVAALSGTTTKGNNLGKLAVPVTAGSTTLTVPFPPQSYPNVSNIQLIAVASGGTLTAGTYNYRFAARTRYGGPVLATANQSITLTTQTAISMVIDGLYDTASGIQIAGVTVYRGPTSGNYTTRYDLIPSGEFAAMGGGSTGNNKRVALLDAGTTIPGMTPGGFGFVQGYTFPITAQSGTFTPVDESGWEPDTNYAVFVDPSWHTTCRVTARRRDGFDLEFGVPAPTGTNSISWMIARF